MGTRQTAQEMDAMKRQLDDAPIRTKAAGDEYRRGYDAIDWSNKDAPVVSEAKSGDSVEIGCPAGLYGTGCIRCFERACANRREPYRCGFDPGGPEAHGYGKGTNKQCETCPSRGRCEGLRAESDRRTAESEADKAMAELVLAAEAIGTLPHSARVDIGAEICDRFNAALAAWRALKES
jgi:hypothetical protein